LVSGRPGAPRTFSSPLTNRPEFNTCRRARPARSGRLSANSLVTISAGHTRVASGTGRRGPRVGAPGWIRTAHRAAKGCPMADRTVTIARASGLHARPAALFSQAAGQQPAQVTIAKGAGEAVQASSILMLLTLGADQGDEVTL